MNNKAKYTISIAGEEIEVRRERKPLGELKLDPRNQRIQYLLRAKGKEPSKVSESEIQDILWEHDWVKNLKESIRDVGLIDPLVVEANGRVIEGNCRLIALRKLYEENPEDENFCLAPCEFFPEGLTEELRSLLLGVWHVAGKHEWVPYEQAEHLYRMNKVFGKTHDALASHFRLARATIQKRIAAYEMMTEYLKKSASPDVRKWSYFEEFHKKKPLVERSRRDSQFKEKFFRWVEEGKLTRGEQVRVLPEVIQNPELEQLLDEQGFSAVEQHRNASMPELTSKDYKVISKATQALENLSSSEIAELRNGNSAKVREFIKLGKVWKRIADMARLSLEK